MVSTELAHEMARPVQPSIELFRLIGEQVAVLWRSWPKAMEHRYHFRAGSSLSEHMLNGECPHCHDISNFDAVTAFHQEPVFPDESLLVGVFQCPGCRKFVLGILKRDRQYRDGGEAVDVVEYLEHYPIGEPDDSQDDAIPDHVASDFKEAIRCRWIKALKATVLMCRRSLQASCDALGAEGKDLFTQVDDLADNKRRITPSLKKMAHRIRLLGNKGAHRDYADIDDTITEHDADEALKFMRHYLEHVYVMDRELNDSES